MTVYAHDGRQILIELLAWSLEELDEDGEEEEVGVVGEAADLLARVKGYIVYVARLTHSPIFALSPLLTF